MGGEGRGGEGKKSKEGKRNKGVCFTLSPISSPLPLLFPPLLTPATQVTANLQINPLSPNVHIQILQTDLYTFP